MMRQMGIKQEEINALRVVIETPEKNLIIEPASVQKINMQGNESFQVSGEVREEATVAQFSKEDISTIIQQTNCTEEEARKALKETGDLAEAILKLSAKSEKHMPPNPKGLGL